MADPREKRNENLRRINSSKTIKELKEILASLKIWRVEVTMDKGEDRTVKNGYCVYISMAQLRNEEIRKYDLRKRVDRLEVGM